MKNLLLLILLLFIGYKAVYAEDKLPKFMSLKVSEANVRAGPGNDFPIKWILIRKSLPLEIIDDFDNWYKVRDEEEREGWIHKSLISSKRYFVIKKQQVKLFQNPKHNVVIFKLELGVRGKIISCRSKWCKVSVRRYQGWILKEDIWGAYQYENF